MRQNDLESFESRLVKQKKIDVVQLTVNCMSNLLFSMLIKKTFFIRRAFAVCGDIADVRLVRDSSTGIGMCWLFCIVELSSVADSAHEGPDIQFRFRPRV